MNAKVEDKVLLELRTKWFLGWNRNNPLPYCAEPVREIKITRSLANRVMG